MTAEENLQNLGILPSTVLKILQKTDLSCLIFEPSVMVEFRLKNALYFYNFLKMDLMKIP